MGILILASVAVLALLGALAGRYGADSRRLDGSDWTAR